MSRNIDIDVKEYSVSPDFWSSDYLFHYTSSQTALEHILYKRQLRLGPFSSTSDPFEYNEIFVGVGIGATSPTEDEHKSRIGHAAAKRLTEEFASYRFLAFCCSNDQPGNFDQLGMLKPRMWSQYGANHTGVCLVFSKRKILQTLESLGHRPHSKRLNYVNFSSGFWSYPAIDVPDGTSLSEDELFRSHRDGYKDKYFFSKHLDYRDEEEFRIIVSMPGEDFLYFDFQDSLQAIVVSDRTGKYQKEQSVRYATEFGVPLLSLGWYFRSPSIFHLREKSMDSKEQLDGVPGANQPG